MIDWFTVIAQIVNFLILVGLLRYFLYRRVLAAMDGRQQEIAARWDEAQQQRREAEQELDAAREKNRRLDEQRERLLAQVREEVDAHRQQLVAKVRAEVDELHERWSDAIQEETQSFLADLRRRVSQEVCAIARRALADLASADLERQIVEQFLRQVKQLGDDERRDVIASLQESNRVAVVETSHELDPALQEAVRDTLKKQLVGSLDIRFQQSDELLCGIAMQTDAHKLAWDLRDYLLTLEQELQQSLEEETTTRRSRQQETAGTER